MIEKVWQRVMGLAKSGTSGMDAEDEFNSKVIAAQQKLAALFKAVDEENEMVSQALSWLKKSTGLVTTVTDGSIPAQSDFSSLITVTLIAAGKRYPGTKYRNNEVETARTSPILQPDLTKNELGFYNRSGKIFTMPEQAGTTVDMAYYIKLPDATIVLTPSQSDDYDLVIPTVGVDFGWPEFCFNLLVYMIAEQFGVEIREEALLEFSQYGITLEMIKTTPQ